jgi:lysophospholipase L1-like esterase
MTAGRRASITPTRRSTRPRTYWLGDSFFVGGGSRYPGFSDLVHVAGTRLHAAEVVVDALGGTGYLARNKGARFPNYMTRLRRNLRRISPRPDVVVVGGSINDVRYGRARVRRAASRLFAYIAKVAPSTKVVAVPFTTRFPPPRGVEKVVQGVADAAREAPNVAYLPLPDRVARLEHHDRTYLARLQRSDGHPSPTGHTVFGRVIGDFLSHRLRR